MVQPVKFEDVENKIIELREQKVILDADVALLYGVSTKEINQAVRNNPDKFPEGYIFSLERDEKEEVVKRFDHLRRLKFSPQLPKAFTEKGLYMLATILRGIKATQTTLSIIEAYAGIRQFSRSLAVLASANDGAERQHLLQKSSELITRVLGPELPPAESETTVELNFVVLKVRHTVKGTSNNSLHESLTLSIPSDGGEI